VTGSNVNLGKEAARHFARLGASKVILAVRNGKAGEEREKDIETSTKCGTAITEVWSLDLSSYKSVKLFADRASKLPRLDVFLENASVAGNKCHLPGAMNLWSSQCHQHLLSGHADATEAKVLRKRVRYYAPPRNRIERNPPQDEIPEWKEPNNRQP
jgi:NAD(P)-dependent dehydrogenase (short-subunit alcohol dehydrogenase family)